MQRKLPEADAAGYAQVALAGSGRTEVSSVGTSVLGSTRSALVME